MALPTIIQLFHHQGTQSSTSWVIWAGRNAQEVPSKIPNFVSTAYFRKNAIVFHDDRIYRAKKTIMTGQFNENEWDEIPMQTGFIARHDPLRDYEADSFILDASDTLLKNKYALEAKAFDSNDWTVVQTADIIETATVYLAELDAVTETSIEDGTFILLGGVPEDYDPFEKLGAIDTYFERARPGLWFDFGDEATCTVDITGFVPCAPGDPVAFVHAEQGDVALMQSDASLRPIYREDASGKGYIEFSGDQHLLLDTGLGKTALHEFYGIPGTGSMTFAEQDESVRIVRVGPKYPDPLKKWSLSEVAFLTDTMTEAEISAVGEEMNTRASTTYPSDALQSMSHWFYQDPDFNQDISDWEMFGKVDLRSMFQSATAFNQPLGDWDVQTVRYTDYMFSYAELFNQPLNTWDFADLESATGMFSYASAFNQNLNRWEMFGVHSTAYMFQHATSFNGSLAKWNLSRTSDVRYMFDGASAFNQPVNQFGLSQITALTAMFRNAVAFNQPVDSWFTNNVTDIAFVFQGATSFNQDLPWDTSKVVTAQSAFDGATVFNGDISTWDVREITVYAFMFRGAVAFNGTISLWETDSAKNMDGMFDGALAFSGDLSNWCVSGIATEPTNFDASANPAWADVEAVQPKWGAPCLKFIAHSFYNANIISTLFQDTEGLIPVSQPGDKVLKMLDLSVNGNHAFSTLATAPTYRVDANGNGYLEFNNDESMTFQDSGDNYHTWETIPSVGVLKLTDTDTSIGPKTVGNQRRFIGQFVALPDTYDAAMEAAAVDFVDDSYQLYPAGTVTSLDYYLEGLNTFNGDVSHWETSAITSMKGTFLNASVFNQELPWDTSSVIDMSYMFAGASAFNQDLSAWDTSSVKTMSYMFADAVAFNRDLSWDTSSVEVFSFMFDSASGFNSQVLLDLSAALTIESMFQDAIVFNRPLVGPAPVLENAKNVFKGAALFNSPVTNLIGSTVKDISGIFDGANQFNQVVNTWDVSSVVSMVRSFHRAANFNQELNTWTTDALTDLTETFKDAVKYNKALDAWNTSAVTSLKSTFDGAAVFDQDIEAWDVRLVKSFYRTFSGALLFNSPVNLWRTESAETFEMMFQSAESFNKDISNWETGTVTNFDRMFFNAKVFNQDISPWCVKQIPSTGPTLFAFGCPLVPDWHPIWGARCLADMADLWYDASDSSRVFSDMAKTTTPNPGDRVAVLVDKGNLGIDAVQADVALRPIYRVDENGLGYLEFPVGSELVASGVNGTGVWVNNIPSVGGWGDYITVPSSVFKIGFTSTDDPLASRKLGQLVTYFGSPSPSDIVVLNKAATRWAKLYAPGTVTNINAALEDIAEFDWNVDNWIMDEVTHADFLFSGCEIYNHPMDSWNTSKLVSAKGMFKDAMDFNQQLPWDLSALQDASFMFQNADAFDQSINAWTTSAVTTMEGMFYGARSFNQPVDGLDTSAVTNMKDMFHGAVRFNRTLSTWDVSKVTTFEGMFQATEDFNSSLLSWATSSGLNFSKMFMGSNFNQPVNHFDLSSATDVSNMFREATKFAQPLDLWDVSSVVNFAGMFFGADAFNHNISTWQFAAADIIMDDMFREASIFNYDISQWDTTNVTTMMNMFRNAYEFSQNLVTWCVKNVDPLEAAYFGENTKMAAASQPLFGEPCVGEFLDGYYDASIKALLGTNTDGTGTPVPGDKIAFIGDLSGKNNNAVQADVALRPEYQEDVNGRGYLIFRDNQHFTVAGITGTSRNWVSIAGRGVPEWSDQTNAPAKIGIKVAGGPNKVWYWGAEGISTSALGSTEEGYIRQALKMRADAYPIDLQLSIAYLLAEEEFASGGMSDFRLTNIASLEGLFKNAVNYNEDISNWDTSVIGNLRATFMGAYSFNHDLSGWVVDQVQFLEDTFHGASSFTSDLSGWNVGKVRSFNRAFKDASAFTSDLSTWTIRGDVVVSMIGMFANATSFNSDLNNWNMTKVVSTADMFWGTQAFDSELNQWDMSSNTNMTNMFRTCPLFNSDIGDWNVSNVLTMNAMFDGAAAFDQDISRWCVSQISSVPPSFDASSGFEGNGALQPAWGGFCLTVRSEFFHSGRDKDFMFQDVAQTVPVTLPGQPVAFVQDLTGNGRHLTQSDVSKRPLFMTDADGNGYLEFGPNHDMVVDYNGRADHIIGVVGRGKLTTQNLDFFGGRSIKAYFTPNRIGTHRLTDMAGISTTLSAADKTSANNTMRDRAKNYAPSAQASMSNFFSGNLNFNNADVQTWDMRDVTDISFMFDGCASMNLDLSAWNTSNLLNASYAFNNAGTFNKSIDNWNVSKVTNMTGMFMGATSYDSAMPSWTPTAVTSTKWMFKNAIAFNRALPWTFNVLNDVSFMFEGATKFNQNISAWDLSKVTTAEGMFKNATSFNNASASMAGMDWSSCTVFRSMFQGALLFNADVANWALYTGGVGITMQAMFRDARAFNRNITSWNTTRVTNMSEMFMGAYAFNNANSPMNEAVSNFNVANVTTMQRMFQDARVFNQQIVDWTTAKVTDMGYMFYSNSAVSAFNQNIGGWDVSAVQLMNDMFHNATSFNQNLANWNVTAVTNFARMFRGATVYNNGSVNELERWNTAAATSMTAMFEFATAFNMMLCRWTTTNVNNMDNMFNGATAMTAYLAGWDVQHIPNEPSLFGAVNVTNKPRWGQPPEPCRSDCSRSLVGAGATAAWLGFESQWMYQDQAGTVPVTAPGQKVLLLEDSSGEGNDLQFSSADYAPIYQEDANGNGYLEFPEGTSLSYSNYTSGVHIAFKLLNVGTAVVTRTSSNGNIFSYPRSEPFRISAIAMAPATVDATGIKTVMEACGPTYVDNNTTMDNLFAQEEMIGDIVGLNTANITSFSGTFRNAITFNQDISTWSTGNATKLDFMFNGAEVFNQNISGWNVTKVTTTKGMFANAPAFNNGEAAGESSAPLTWTTSALTDISGMFWGVIAFNQDISTWDVSKVTNMAGTFRDASSFSQNIAGWTTSSLTVMQSTFEGASSFNAPIGSWDVSNVESMGATFKNAVGFDQPLNTWDTSSVTTTNEMFKGATAYNRPMDNWTMTSVFDARSMFAGAALFNQDLSMWDMSSALWLEYMFEGATAFNGDITTWDVSKAESFTGMFKDTVAFNQAIGLWKTTSALNFARMFQNATGFNQPIGRWDTSKVSNFTSMFEDATAFNQAIGCWNTASASNMNNMFCNATLFDQYISGWCVDGISSKPDNFDVGGSIGFLNNTDKQPQWGTCPPGNLSADNVLAIFNPLDRSTLWQDEARSVPVTSVGDVVKGVTDASGNGVHGTITDGTAYYREDANGLGYVEFGDSALLQMGSATQDYDVAWIIPGVGEAVSTRSSDNLWHWGNESTANAGPIIWTNKGSGSSVRGLDCISYAAGTTTNLAYTFYRDEDFNYDISHWNTTGVTNMESMFVRNFLFDQDISNWDVSSVENFNMMFAGCVLFNAPLDKWDVSSATTMNFMFETCEKFDQDLNSWDVSNVTDMSYMFSYATIFNGNISDWDVSSVVTTEYMFSTCALFNQDITGWQVTSLERPEGMFIECGAFNQPIGVWDTTAFTTIESMFQESAVFNQDLSNWVLDNVTSTAYTFMRAQAFNQDLNAWNTSNVTDMNHMFCQAPVFNNGSAAGLSDNPLTFDTSSVTRMNTMFNAANAFNQPIGSWDVSKVERFEEMFLDNTIFNQPLGCWRTPEATIMHYMFENASVFDQNLTSWCVPKITSAPPRFNSGSALDSLLLPIWGTCTPGTLGSADTYAMFPIIDGQGLYSDAARTTPAVVGGSVSGLEDMSGNGNHGVFAGGSAELKQDANGLHYLIVPASVKLMVPTLGENRFDVGFTVPSVGSAVITTEDTSGNGSFWGKDERLFVSQIIYAAENSGETITGAECTKFSGVTVVSLDYLFEGALAFKTDLTTWNTSAVTSMNYTFANTEGTVDLSAWDVSNVTSFVETFSYSAIDVGDLSNWTTTSATTMEAMFAGATGIDTEFTNWSTANVTNTTYMFADAGVWNPDLTMFDMSKVEDANSMFAGSEMNPDVSGWDLSACTSTMSMFRDAVNFNGDVSNWTFTVLANTISMFMGATTFNSGAVPGAAGPVLNWATGNVTNMAAMFKDAVGFNCDISGWDISNVVAMPSFAQGATMFNSVLTNWNPVKLTAMDFAFENALAFNNGAAKGIEGPALTWSTPAIVTFTRVFRGASSFNCDISGWTIKGDASEAFAFATDFNQSLDGVTFDSVTDATRMFYTASSFNNGNAAGVLGSMTFDMSTIAQMESMFEGCSDLNATLATPDFSSTTSTKAMFKDCTKLNAEVLSYDLTGVTDVTEMFAGCTLLNNNGLAATMNTSTVETFTAMFKDCPAFNVDLANFDMSSATTIEAMFQNALAFNRAIGSWDVSNVVTATNVFAGAKAFNQKVGCWDTSSMTEMSGMFNGATAFSQNISSWCVNGISTEPTDFATGSAIASDSALKPQWGAVCVTGAATGSNVLGQYPVTTPAYLYQDVAKTTPVTAAGQTIAAIEDSSGNGNDLVFTGTATYEHDGVNGYVKLAAGTKATIAGITTAADIAFLIPGVGATYVSHQADPAGVTYWEKPAEHNLGGMIITESGSGSTVTGFECFRYSEGVTTSLAYVFADEATFNQEIGDWNTSTITDMSHMFYNASAFNTDVSTWDVSKVTTMESMFQGAGSYNTVIDGWTTTELANTKAMFRDATSFNRPVASLTMDKVTDSSQMFMGATVFNRSVSGWTMTAVTDMSDMFNAAQLFNQPLTWTTTSSLTNIDRLLKDAVSFNSSVDIDTSAVVSAIEAFRGTWAFNAAFGSSFVLPLCKDLSGMFRDATAFDQNVSAFAPNAGENFSDMFRGATVFNTAITGWTMAAATLTPRMFSEANAFNQDISTWSMANVTDMSYMFGSATAFDQEVDTWDYGSVTSIAGFLYRASSFSKTLDGMSLPATATDLSDFFNGASSFDASLDHWDVSNVTTMARMFMDASSFSQSVTSWNPVVCTDMEEMFRGAVLFNQPMPCWNVSAVENMVGMFRDATSFDQNISGWCVGNNIATEPLNFAVNSPIDNSAKEPQWGVPCTPGAGLSATDLLATFRVDSPASLYQDAGKTVPVTVAGQTVAVIEDSSGNNNDAVTTGTVTYREDSAGVGYLEFDATAGYRVPSITQAADIAFVIPGVGESWVSRDADPLGVHYWLKPAATVVGSMVVTAQGSGNTATGFICLGHSEKVTTSLSYMFAMDNVAIGSIADWDLTGITDVSYMFDTTTFNEDISGWDVSAVTTFEGMFKDSTAFDHNLNAWNVSSATTFANAFDGATAFNNNSNALTWTSAQPNLTVSNMFAGATSFNQSVDALVTANVTDMTGFMSGASAFNQPVNAWDISGVTTFANLFANATSFNNGEGTGLSTAPITWDTVNVTDFTGMFQNATSFNQDLPGWTASGALTDMFRGAALFNQNVDDWVTDDVTNLEGVFRDAVAFNNGQAIGNATAPFSWTAPLATTHAHMFHGASEFAQDICTLDTGSSTTLSYFLAGTKNDKPCIINMTNVKDVSYMFAGNTSFNQPLVTIDVSGVENFEGMFDGATAFNQPLACWDTSAATIMDALFRDASAFDQDLTGWCTPNITTAPTDFSTGSSIQPANVPDWANMASCSPGAGLSSASTLASYDPRDITTLWQDASRTIPITATGQVVRGITDLSGNGNHAVFPESNGAVYFTDGIGNGLLQFDHFGDMHIPTITDAADFAFMVPAIGDTVIPRPADANGIRFFDRSVSTSARIGPILVTATGQGSTVTGFECISYAPGATSSLEGFFAEEPFFNGDLSTWNTTGVTSMRAMFQDSGFNQDVSTLDTSSVTDMYRMFYDNTVFNQDVSMFDVSNVSNMSEMFRGATAFDNGGVSMDAWSPKPGANLSMLFYGASVFNQSVNGWAISGACNITSMFQNALVFNQDLDQWDVSAITNMYNLFNGARKFNGNVDGWVTSNVTRLYQTFYNAREFNRDITGWDVSKVYDFHACFGFANLFNQDLNGWDVSKATNMFGMFWGNQSFNNGSASGAVDNPLVWSTPVLNSTRWMFLNAAAFAQELQIDFGTVTDCRQMFDNCDNWNHNINGWDFSSATSVYGMFQNNAMFNNGDAPGLKGNALNLNTTNATSFGSMFKATDSFNQDVTMDCTSVSNMMSMFENAKVFDGDLSGLDTTNVDNTSRMFYSADVFTGIGIDNWDMNAVLNASLMFSFAPVFNKSLPNWDFAACTNMNNMFESASAMNGDISAWCVPNITSAPSSFDTSAAFMGNAALQPQWGVPCTP